MSDFTNWNVTEAMLKYGGNFVQMLALLYRAGDSDNRKRLVTAFPEYWEKYRQIAVELEQRKNALQGHP